MVLFALQADVYTQDKEHGMTPLMFALDLVRAPGVCFGVCVYVCVCDMRVRACGWTKTKAETPRLASGLGRQSFARRFASCRFAGCLLGARTYKAESRM